MGQMLELMAAPFAACVVLVGIHAYLGMHVIQRKIIFVDLALAQIAALGATFCFLLGIGPHERGAYFFSLAFAGVFAALDFGGEPGSLDFGVPFLGIGGDVPLWVSLAAGDFIVKIVVGLMMLAPYGALLGATKPGALSPEA